MAAKSQVASKADATGAAVGLDGLVAQAYESACNPDGLLTFIRETARYFAAPRSVMAMWTEDDPESFLPIPFGINTEDLNWMVAKDGKGESLFARLDKLQSGQTILAHAGDMHLLAGLTTTADNKRCAMVLFRDAQDSQFKLSDQQSLASLLGYYQRAFATNMRFMRLCGEHEVAFAALDFAPRAIIFLAKSGQIAYQNSSAHTILQNSDGIRENQGSMHIDDARIQRKLVAFIADLVAGDAAGDIDRMICKIPRHSGAPAYQLIVSPIPVNSVSASAVDLDLLAMAIIHNPDDLVDLDTHFLQTFYELTPAEARLAQALHKHENLARASKALGITVNTARSELKRIFKKVGVNSQSALLVEFTKALKDF